MTSGDVMGVYHGKNEELIVLYTPLVGWNAAMAILQKALSAWVIKSPLDSL